MVAPTRDDAHLIVQLTQLAVSSGLMDSMQKLWEDDFDPDSADPRDPDITKVLGQFEIIGTLTKNGLLNEGLVKDTWWVEGIWAKVGPAALKAREAAGEPRLYENFEALVRS